MEVHLHGPGVSVAQKPASVARLDDSGIEADLAPPKPWLELLPDELLQLVFDQLEVSDRVMLSIVSKRMLAVYRKVAMVAPGTLDARWQPQPLPAVLDAVAEYWHKHQGINVLQLPRFDEFPWRLENLAQELDRVQLGVRCIEIYCIRWNGSEAYFKPGPKALLDGSLSACVPLERVGRGPGAERGAAAIRRLVIPTAWHDPRDSATSSLGTIQQLFPSLRDFATASATLAPGPMDSASSELGSASGSLRPFRMLHLMGYYNFQDHPDFNAAVRCSPGLLSLAAKEIELSQAFIDELPDLCPHLRHLRLEDCDKDAFLTFSGNETWGNQLARKMPDCDVICTPDYSQIFGF